MSDRRTGVVLAGGYSTRFGERDKALAVVDGTPMIARVVDRLAEVVDEIVISCRDDQRPGFRRVLSALDGDPPVRFVTDPVDDRGPLAGLAASFETVDSTYTAVVACDMPFVDPSFIAFLFEQARGHDAAVPELEDGYLQPTQAVYHVDRLSEVASRRLADDRRSLQGALDELDTVVVGADTVAAHTDPRSLRDINTREDLL
ncbi:MAG: molybdenum cofactor guanylyltransferase [Halohasta sp.]